MQPNSIRHVVRIPLLRSLDGPASRRKHLANIVIGHALVDDVVAKHIARFEWRVGKQRDGRTRYAYRNTRAFGKSFRISMHHVIWEDHFGRIPEGFTIDHADQDGLNNQIANLRLATKSQQGRNQRITQRNTSGFRGVTWDSILGFYKAQVRTGELYYLGRYSTPEEAAVAYNHASVAIGGEYAWINPIPDGSVASDRMAEIITDIDDRYLPRIREALADASQRIRTIRLDGTVSNHRVRRDSSTGYRGVSLDKKTRAYRSSIRFKSRLIFLGDYKVKEEAAFAYNHVSPKLFGDNARLNVLPIDAITPQRQTEIVAKLNSVYLRRAGITA